MEDRPPDIASSYGGRHVERPGRELGVVVLADGEARYPAAGQVDDAGQVELALCGGYLCEVAAPFLVYGGSTEVALTRSGKGWAALSGRVKQW